MRNIPMNRFIYFIDPWGSFPHGNPSFRQRQHELEKYETIEVALLYVYLNGWACDSKYLKLLILTW